MVCADTPRADFVQIYDRYVTENKKVNLLLRDRSEKDDRYHCLQTAWQDREIFRQSLAENTEKAH